MPRICRNPDCQNPIKSNRTAREYCSRACANRDRQRVLNETEKEYQILSCGGGVQSAAMIALFVSGKIETPDMVVMVDTGYEQTSTLNYVNDVLMPACQSKAIPFHMLHTQDNTLWSKTGLILIPAFKQLEDGSIQRLYTLCNGGWKLTVIKKFLRSQGIKRAASWIGISTDEAKRQRKSHQEWLRNRYILIEKNMSRYDCLYLVREQGWPDPQHSSCIMCPQQHDDEWERMKANHPQDYQRCVEIDNEIEERNENIYLHKSMRRLRDIVWRCDVIR